jgi:hypothetical protein
MTKGWHITKKDGQVTVSRQLPARFDVAATTQLAGGNAVRLATQIRQDLWRALQNLRGFSPVVQITPVDGVLNVQAGGRVMGKVTANLQAEILAVLENPKNRSRWQKCAQYQRSKGSV